MADARLMVAVVRSPEAGELALQVRALVAGLGGAAPEYGIRSRGFADLQELGGDLVESLVPGKPFPLSLHQFHRIA